MAGLELLEEVADMIEEQVSDEEWNIHVTYRELAPAYGCHSIGCAIGWGIMKGVIPVEFCEMNRTSLGTVTMWAKWNKLSDYFGIPVDEFNYLFSDQFEPGLLDAIFGRELYHRDLSRLGTARRIRMYVEIKRVIAKYKGVGEVRGVTAERNSI